MAYPTANPIATDHESIPNFAVSPDIMSAQTGNWDDTTTWVGGVVPSATDKVGIDSAHTVTVRNTAAVAYAVGVNGTLKFDPSVDTELVVQHLQVYGAAETGVQGYLEQGTTASPVDATKTCIITIRNTALLTGTAAAPGIDPFQFGNGVICFGKHRMHGSAKTPFRRTSVEPLAAATSFTLASAVTGWRIGDTVAIPDTRHLTEAEYHLNVVHKWEGRTIASFAGADTITNLNAALTWDHLGCREDNGDIFKLPHVANLTRNVKIRSEDGTGVRGHVLWTHRADVDCHYGEFVSMGRTSALDLNNTYLDAAITGATNASPIVLTVPSNIDRATGDSVYVAGVTGNTAANGTWTITVVDETHISLNTSTGNGTYAGGGTVSHIGTNQKGRYNAHAHRVYGPVGGQSNGYSITIKGCTFHEPLPAPGGATLPASKWGLTVHGSSYGLYEDNVVHHWAGGCCMFEDGSEYENMIRGNIFMNAMGNANQRTGTAAGPVDSNGRAGTGLFMNGFDNRVIDNVACGCVNRFVCIVSGSGYYWFFPSTGASYNIPNFVGANPTTDGTSVNGQLRPLLEVSGNEAYGGMATGYIIWNLGTSGYTAPVMAESVIADAVVWHVFEEAWFGYPTNHITFRNWDVVGDKNTYGNTSIQLTAFVWGDYLNVDGKIENCRIRCCVYGVVNNLSIRGTFTIKDNTFVTRDHPIVVSVPFTPGTFAEHEDHETILQNNLATRAVNGWGAPFVEADWSELATYYTTSQTYTNLRVLNKITVIDHQQVPGDNFRLYFTQQAGDFVMPQDGFQGNSTGCPEAGLTNAQAYVKYHSDGTLKVPTGSLSDAEGCAIAGAVAPASATTRENILGLVQATSSTQYLALAVGGQFLAFSIG